MEEKIELEEIVQNVLEKAITEDKTIHNEDKLFELLGKIELVNKVATAILSAGYIKKSEVECDEEKLRNFIGDLMVKDDLSFQITGGHPQDMLMYVAHTIATNLKSIIK